MKSNTDHAIDQLKIKYDKATHNYFYELNRLFTLVKEYDKMLISYYSKKEPATQQIMKNQYKKIKTKIEVLEKLEIELDWVYQLTYEEKRYSNSILAINQMTSENLEFVKELFEIT